MFHEGLKRSTATGSSYLPRLGLQVWWLDVGKGRGRFDIATLAQSIWKASRIIQLVLLLTHDLASCIMAFFIRRESETCRSVHGQKVAPACRSGIVIVRP